ncbi:MAG: DUF4834 family protein [Bacteroidales bacterium]|nr:DUF4834 family protein [Bacteroidales bacterium]
MAFLFTLFLIYLLGILFFRFFVPLLATLWMRRWSKRVQDRSQTFWGTEPAGNRREGEVTVDAGAARRTEGRPRKIFRDTDGEYIDFEEVE